MAFYCSDCRNLNTKDENRYGEYWCNGWSSYVSPSKIANHCRKFYYIYNLTFDILQKNTNNEVFENGLKLKEEYLFTSVDCISFVDDYYKYAPKLCEKIENDNDKEYIADYIYNHCLEPVYEYVEKNEYDKAYVIFQKAFYEMLHTFDIQIENKKTNKKIKRLMNENH